MELAGSEGVLLALPESEDDLAELSLVDLAGVSDFESESELEEDEPSLEPFLLSAGGLGRP